MLEAPFDLNSLLSTTTVECVQTVDAGKLAQLLQWVVTCLQTQDTNAEARREELLALKGDCIAAKGDSHRSMDDLHRSQEALSVVLEKTQSNIHGLAESVEKLQRKFEELELKDNNASSVEGTDVQLIEQRSDELTDRLLKRMDSIEQRLTVSLEEKAAACNPPEDARVTSVPGSAYRPSADDESSFSVELLEKKMDDFERQLNTLSLTVEERYAPVPRPTEARTVSEASLDEGSLDPSSGRQETSSAPADGTETTSISYEVNSSCQQSQDEGVECSPKDGATGVEEPSDAQDADSGSPNAVQIHEISTDTATSMEGVDTKRAPRLDEIEERMALLEVSLESLTASQAQVPILSPSSNKTRGVQIMNRSPQLADNLREVPEKKGISPEYPSKAQPDHRTVEPEHDIEDDAAKAERISLRPATKAVSLASDEVYDALAELKADIESLHSSKADKDSLEALQCLVESFQRQSASQDHSKSKFLQNEPPQTGSAFQSEQRGDLSPTEDMKEQIQELRKSVRNLLNSLRSIDPIEIETLTKRLTHVEDRVKKLARRKLATGPPPPDRVPDGNQAMLSGKPIFGYKCMACDRPLKKLHLVKGPFLPTNALPPSRPKSCGDVVGRDAESVSETDLHSPRLETAPIGPLLKKGGWKTHGNYHKKLKTKLRERQRAA